jgi:hypothetical protein
VGRGCRGLEGRKGKVEIAVVHDDDDIIMC